MKSLVEKLNLKNALKREIFKYWSGNVLITSNLVGKEISVYNGKLFKSFKVLELMVGYKIGHFIFTRRVGSEIHKSKKFKKK